MPLRKTANVALLAALFGSGAIAQAQGSAYKLPLTIAIVNQSTVVSNADAATWAAAIQRQVHEDLAPAWKIDADVLFQDAASDDAWVCSIVDGPLDAGTPLGTHAVRDNGAPGCTVNARIILALQTGDVSKHLSHEILEMLVDPWLSNVSFTPSNLPNGVIIYLREICDPVWAAGYAIDGVSVADFTLPEFWDGHGIGKRLDRLGVAIIPLQPTAHSYMLARFVTPYAGIDSIESWSYIWGGYCAFGPC
jgi:hypothetical protein